MDLVSWSLDYFQKPPLGGRPNTKQGDHGIPNAHNRRIIPFYHMWEPAWIKIHWNSIWLRVQSHMNSHYTWGSETTLHDFWRCVGTAFEHFSFGLSHFHGHGSSLVCEVAPLHIYMMRGREFCNSNFQSLFLTCHPKKEWKWKALSEDHISMIDYQKHDSLSHHWNVGDLMVRITNTTIFWCRGFRVQVTITIDWLVELNHLFPIETHWESIEFRSFDHNSVMTHVHVFQC
jgi:hypothetical protein